MQGSIDDDPDIICGENCGCAGPCRKMVARWSVVLMGSFNQAGDWFCLPADFFPPGFVAKQPQETIPHDTQNVGHLSQEAKSEKP